MTEKGCVPFLKFLCYNRRLNNQATPNRDIGNQRRQGTSTYQSSHMVNTSICIVHHLKFVVYFLFARLAGIAALMASGILVHGYGLSVLPRLFLAYPPSPRR